MYFTVDIEVKRKYTVEVEADGEDSAVQAALRVVERGEQEDILSSELIDSAVLDIDATE